MPVASLKRLKRSLRQSAVPRHRGDRRGVGIVIGNPGLAAADHRVLNLACARYARKGLLAHVMPVDQVDPGDLHCGLDADATRDQVEREVHP